MCGRISLFADVETITDRFDVEVPKQLPPRYNIAPSESIGAITNERPTELSQLAWGLVPRWADDPISGPTPINARRESIADSSLFGEPYESQRCLVVVDGYYEWHQTPRGRQPVRFERRDREPFALAGVWDRWTNGEQRLESAAILTTDAVAAVEDVHDRMPVILPKSSEDEWLEEPPSDPTTSALDPAWDDDFHRYPVGSQVNDPANDDPSVIEPVNGDSQPTLADF